MVYFCGKHGQSVEFLRELEQSFKNVSRVKRVIELVQNAKTSEEIKLALILLVPSLSLDNLLFDTGDLEEIRCLILKSLKDKLSQINNDMEVVDMSNISQRFSTVHSEVQHINDKFNELVQKVHNLESIEKTIQSIQDKKTQYEFNLKWKDIVQQEATIIIEQSDIEWHEIQQYLVKYLSNRKSKLEKSIKCSLDVFEQYTKF